MAQETGHHHAVPSCDNIQNDTPGNGPWTCREKLQEELEEAEEGLQAQRQMALAYQTESESLKRQLESLQGAAQEASTLRVTLQEVFCFVPRPSKKPDQACDLLSGFLMD